MHTLICENGACRAECALKKSKGVVVTDSPKVYLGHGDCVTEKATTQHLTMCTANDDEQGPQPGTAATVELAGQAGPCETFFLAPNLNNAAAGTTQCTAQTKGSLITEGGEGNVGTCVFPFSYKDVTYKTCAQKADYGGVGWCAFNSTYTPGSGEWGYCTASCQKAAPATASAIAHYDGYRVQHSAANLYLSMCGGILGVSSTNAVTEGPCERVYVTPFNSTAETTCAPRSPTKWLCGPKYAGHSCSSRTTPYCHEMNGACGSTDAYKNAQESTAYNYCDVPNTNRNVLHTLVCHPLDFLSFFKDSFLFRCKVDS